MTEDTINALPGILKRHICPLKRTSLDDSNNSYMCESNLDVVDFDKIPNEYCRGKGWPCVPNSNDALYIRNDGFWYFIEFKNGSIEKVKPNIFRKIYDSIIMLVELEIIPNLNFSRQNINYILVYNSTKNSKLQESKSRDISHAYIMELAKKELKLFGIDKFEKYLFKETHTYSKEAFIEKFVKPMEKDEGIA